VTEQPGDQQLWDAVVAAGQELARCRAEFYRHAESRTETIAWALGRGSWDRSVALEFLAALPDDVPAVLDRLIDLSLSHAWAGAAREAIAPAWRAGTVDDLPQKVLARLDHADNDEYRRLAELLDHLLADDALRELVKRAKTSADPDTREVAEDFSGPNGDPQGRPDDEGPNP